MDALPLVTLLLGCADVASVAAMNTDHFLASLRKELTGVDATVRAQFVAALATLKKNLHPFKTDLTLTKMLQNIGHGEKVARATTKRMRELETKPEFAAHGAAFGRLQELAAEVTKGDAPVGASNRAGRAKPASEVFTAAAGRLRIAGAAADKHGNAAGSQYDLGVDGAFAGLKVVVLHQYRGEGFDFSYPRRAMETKGFRVVIMPEKFTTAALESELATANQLWLVSDKVAHLSTEDIEVIVSAWRSGMAMYVLGDNDPFYVDANRVLTAMGLPTMFGNYIGKRKLGPLTLGAGSISGYLTHFVTTGISEALYEGITIAEFRAEEVRRKGCVSVLLNSRGGVSVILVPGTEGCGQVIADGAFTKLYNEWDEAGSSRFVSNCACWLAADLGSPAGTGAGSLAGSSAGSSAASPADTPCETPEYDTTDALVGVCDMSGERGPLAVLATGLPRVGVNTVDAALNFPLANAVTAPENARVLGAQAFRMDWAQKLVNTGGPDPYRGTSEGLVAFLPCVDLSIGSNYRRFTAALCEVFTDGKHLPTAAWLTFFALCEVQAGASDVHRPEVWAFFRAQCLRAVRTTPTLDGTFTECKVSLGGALAGYVGDLRQPYAAVAVMGHALLYGMPDAVPSNEIHAWVRQAWLRQVLFLVATAAKTGTKAEFDADVDRTYFTHALCGEGKTLWRGTPTLPVCARDTMSRWLPWRGLYPDPVDEPTQVFLFAALRRAHPWEFSMAFEAAQRNLLESALSLVWNGCSVSLAEAMHTLGSDFKLTPLGQCVGKLESGEGSWEELAELLVPAIGGAARDSLSRLAALGWDSAEGRQLEEVTFEALIRWPVPRPLFEERVVNSTANVVAAIAMLVPSHVPVPKKLPHLLFAVAVWCRDHDTDRYTGPRLQTLGEATDRALLAFVHDSEWTEALWRKVRAVAVTPLYSTHRFVECGASLLRWANTQKCDKVAYTEWLTEDCIDATPAQRQVRARVLHVVFHAAMDMVRVCRPLEDVGALLELLPQNPETVVMAWSLDKRAWVCSSTCYTGPGCETESVATTTTFPEDERLRRLEVFAAQVVDWCERVCPTFTAILSAAQTRVQSQGGFWPEVLAATLARLSGAALSDAALCLPLVEKGVW